MILITENKQKTYKIGVKQQPQAKDKDAALAAIKKQGEAGYNPGIHGATNYGTRYKVINLLVVT